MSQAEDEGGWTDHAAWALLLPALLAWQAWMTLGLFDCRDEPRRLLDERPVLSGRHPLHQYHGLLGSRALLRRGVPTCYDPAFHAGYPKTPIFDGGCRPAELALAAAGGDWRPAAYKAMLAATVALVPLFLWLAGRGVGLSRLGAAAASVLGLLVWWGGPCRDLFEAGDVDLLFAALLLLLQNGLLIRYHRDPGPLPLLGVLGSALLAWMTHPLLAAALLPLLAVYYVRVGARHGLAWHAALLGGLAGDVFLNAFWLLDWVQLAWIREPFRGDAAGGVTRGLAGLWGAPLWGAAADRALAAAVLALAAAGAVLFNRGGRRETARLFGLAALGLLALAAAGTQWDPPARFGVVRLAVPALLFAAPLAARPVTGLLRRLPPGVGVPLVLAALAALSAPAWLPAPACGDWAGRLRRPAPLRIGLNERQAALAETLRRSTTPAGRILWEDRRTGRLEAHWSPLLPLLTERGYIGGLDPDAGIEHTSCGLTDGVLAGRPLQDWTDPQLGSYCERYNVGWVVSRTPATTARFGRCGEVVRVSDLGDGAVLFRVKRERLTFALFGEAEWLHADSERIVLGQVTPHFARGSPRKGGKVVLSLHYQAGLRASPGRVVVEPEYDPRDPIPLVRLTLDEPAALVTLTWDRR